MQSQWGISSVGRAFEWHSKGQEFDSPILHTISPRSNVGRFCCNENIGFMKKVRITAVRKVEHEDLIEKYENPIEHACDVNEGDVWIAEECNMPEGFCKSAWDSISPFVIALSHGASGFYDGWMKNPASAMISCNDGFRPVSFLIEVID